MATETIGKKDAPQEADTASGVSLPEWLKALIDPAVLVEHQKKVQRRMTDRADNTVRRRRCAEVVALYLLEEYSND